MTVTGLVPPCAPACVGAGCDPVVCTGKGVPPTERKARTGELTPPGMASLARLNSSSFVVIR